MACSSSPRIMRVCICSRASCSLILLIAKPTWMRTQSPDVGGSSCRSPRSTLRRTPATSTLARCGTPGKSSTIFPGMAKHISVPPDRSFLLAGHNVEGESYLVLHLEPTSDGGNLLNVVVRLPQRELSKGTHDITSYGDARGNRLTVSLAMQCQVPVQGDHVLAVRRVVHRHPRAVIHDFRVLGDLKHSFLHFAPDFMTVLIADVVGDFQRRSFDGDVQRCILQSTGIELGLACKVADGDRGTVSKCRQHSAGRYPDRKSADACVDHVANG